MRALLLALALTLVILSNITDAKAQNQDPILTLPDGQVILNISATERREVEQDLLVANLSYVVTDKSSNSLQNEINTIMARAIKAAKAVEEIKVSTGAYQVYEFTEPRTKENKWRGSQSLTLKSKEADKILDLTSKLQDMGLTMNGLDYVLAPETAIDIQDSLMEDALKQLQERANRAAKALGKSSAELRDVNVNSSGIPYEPAAYNRGAMMKMEMAADSMAAPVAAAGDSTITLSVNARAILKP